MPKAPRKAISKPSGNWALLSKKIGAGSQKRKMHAEATTQRPPAEENSEQLRNMALQWEGVLDPETKRRVVLGHDELPESQRELGHFVALDCEMVGAGYKGSRSVLARVSVVNWYGHVVLDTFVRPKEVVTDYRTWVSGVRARDLRDAPSFEQVQQQVADILKGRVLVGHAVQNDLKALLLSHPHTMTRDTSNFKPLCEKTGKKQSSLRELASVLLGITIQVKGVSHSSVEDARATMAVFRTQKELWDQLLSVGKKSKRKQNGKDNASAAAAAPGAGAGPSEETRAEKPEAAPARRPQSAPEWWLE